MTKNNQIHSQVNIGNIELQTPLGSCIQKALTEDEISQLLNVLFAILLDEQCLTALAQLGIEPRYVFFPVR